MILNGPNYQLVGPAHPTDDRGIHKEVEILKRKQNSSLPCNASKHCSALQSSFHCISKQTLQNLIFFCPYSSQLFFPLLLSTMQFPSVVPAISITPQPDPPKSRNPKETSVPTRTSPDRIGRSPNSAEKERFMKPEGCSTKCPTRMLSHGPP